MSALLQHFRRVARNRFHQPGCDSKDISGEQGSRASACDQQSQCPQHGLPAHVVIHYVITLALYMQSPCHEVLRCLLDGVR